MGGLTVALYKLYS